MNVKRLKQVAKLIQEHPTQFNMEWWFKNTNAVGGRAGGCGTAACIGGWAVFLKRRVKSLDKLQGQFIPALAGADIQEEAALYLGLHYPGTDRLFVPTEWPDKFREAYENAKTAKEAAQVAVKRIHNFIKTGGQE
jgi:hypothetical protein